MTEQLNDTIHKINCQAATMRTDGQNLVSAIHRVAALLSACLPENFVFRSNLVEYRSNPSHAGRCYHSPGISHAGQYYSNQGKPIPAEWEDAGKQRNSVVRNANRDEILQVGKDLPDFLAALLESLKTNNAHLNTARAVLENMIRKGE